MVGIAFECFGRLVETLLEVTQLVGQQRRVVGRLECVRAQPARPCAW
jgi:hypothetical protein